jgi:hypothetical protein
VKSTIASFPTSTGNGTEPDGQLFIDSNGDLRGATVHGGTDPNPANQKGTTYEIAKIAGGYATTPTFLADIPGGLNTLVDVPNLSADANGDLFGLMFSGGESLNFPQAAAPKSNWRTSPSPPAPPTREGGCWSTPAAIWFGTTLSGGDHGSGTVFEYQKSDQ